MVVSAGISLVGGLSLGLGGGVVVVVWEGRRLVDKLDLAWVHGVFQVEGL